MTRYFWILAAAAWLLPVAGAATSCEDEDLTAADAAGNAPVEEAYVPGEIIVWFLDGLKKSAIEDAVAETGGEVLRYSRVTPSRVTISVPEGKEDTYVEAYRELDIVEVADKNYELEALSTEESGGKVGIDEVKGAPGPGPDDI
ncbi:MAG: hypothetical protein JSU81_06565 [Candidatus Coatesbacteria bacterium]|nr:MAG: hypothetical protein JSU81_06565 [Candidatus Coatesbacteria bacterium]